MSIFMRGDIASTHNWVLRLLVKNDHAARAIAANQRREMPRRAGAPRNASSGSSPSSDKTMFMREFWIRAGALGMTS
jgi:hypothetical protein